MDGAPNAPRTKAGRPCGWATRAWDGRPRGCRPAVSNFGFALPRSIRAKSPDPSRGRAASLPRSRRGRLPSKGMAMHALLGHVFAAPRPHECRVRRAGTPIPSELVTGFAHKRADLLPEGLVSLLAGNAIPNASSLRCPSWAVGRNVTVQPVGVKQLKWRSGPGPVGVVCVQDRRVVDLDRREHIQALKFGWPNRRLPNHVDGRTKQCTSTWSPPPTARPVRACPCRGRARAPRAPNPPGRIQALGQPQGRRLQPQRATSHRGPERHAVGRRGRAGHEKGKRAAGPQGPIAAHAQKLNGV